MRRLVSLTALFFVFAYCQEKSPDLPNFGQVDNHVYRGAQPSREGLARLAKEKGIKTVIDLRGGESRSEAEESWVKSLGMDYISFPMNAKVMPKDSQIEEVLRKIEAAKGPVFIHCYRGRDRTGTVVACYRITKQGWANERALDEAQQYGLNWTHIHLQRYIKGYRPPQANSQKTK